MDVPQEQQASMCSIFVKGLNKNTAANTLVTVFSRFGAVIQCQIARHRSGRSAGFAIITYSMHEEALGALQAVDNSVFLGRRLNVRWYQPERDSMSAQQMQMLSFDGFNFGQDLFHPQGKASAVAFSNLAQKQAAFDITMGLPQLGQSADQGVEAWMPDAQAIGNPGSAGGALEEPMKDANWSAMVGMWLNDYESLHGELNRRGTNQSSLASPPQRRTTNQSTFSFQETTDLSGFRLTADSMGGAFQEDHQPDHHFEALKLVDDPVSFGKSRLVTKWGRASGSGGGSTIDERSSEGDSTHSQMGIDEVGRSDNSMTDTVVLPELDIAANLALPAADTATLSMRKTWTNGDHKRGNLGLGSKTWGPVEPSATTLNPMPTLGMRVSAPGDMDSQLQHLTNKFASMQQQQQKGFTMQSHRQQQAAAAAAAMETHATATLATVNDAQKLYASALCQINNARAQILAAAAAMQMPPSAMHDSFIQANPFMQTQFHQNMMQGMFAGGMPPPPPVGQRQAYNFSRQGY